MWPHKINAPLCVRKVRGGCKVVDLTWTPEYYTRGGDNTLACVATNLLLAAQSIFVALTCFTGEATTKYPPALRHASTLYGIARLASGLGNLFGGAWHYLGEIGNIQGPRVDMSASAVAGGIPLSNECYYESALNVSWLMYHACFGLVMASGPLLLGSACCVLLDLASNDRAASAVSALSWLAAACSVVFFCCISDDRLLHAVVFFFVPTAAQWLACALLLLPPALTRVRCPPPGRAGAWLVAGGGVVEFVGTVYTQMVIGPDCWAPCPAKCPLPPWFNNNAAYHVLVAAAHAMMDEGTRRVLHARAAARQAENRRSD